MKGLEKTYQDAFMALNNGRLPDAERLFTKFLRKQPSHIGALNLLTVTLMSMERFAEAEPLIARAVKLNRSSDVSFYNYGLILKRLGKLEQALEQFNSALRLNGTVFETWNNRGTVFNEMQQYERALADFEKAISLNPRYAEAHCNKGRALSRLRRHDDAIAAYDEALALNSAMMEGWLGRGNACAEAKRYDEAIAAYQKAATLQPDLAVAHTCMGGLLKEMGRMTQARDAYAAALRIDPGAAEIHHALAELKRFTPGDTQLAAMEELLAAGNTSPRDRMCLEFALGKAHADIGDHQRSFRHWLSANAVMRAQIDYDEASNFELFDDIEKIFTPELIAANGSGGDPSPLPIFVLGMPRSGTTLIEQILASHPAIQGAGELKLLDDVLNTTPDPDGTILPYPDCVPALDAAGIRNIGTRYVAELSRLAPDTIRIVDKMPANFLFVGMIHLALPHATIIHTIRDPVDTCVSCFMQLFTEPQDYAYDLAELGCYYRRYQRLMAHWHRILPPGSILDVRYEDVVADLEGQTRRLLAHCGVAWDERCLSFYKTERPVRTASATQVRQPIYTNSVGRWHVYEEFLGPLLAELYR